MRHADPETNSADSTARIESKTILLPTLCLSLVPSWQFIYISYIYRIFFYHRVLKLNSFKVPLVDSLKIALYSDVITHSKRKKNENESRNGTTLNEVSIEK